MRWIERYVDRRGRLTQVPLFINPATGTRYTHSAFRRTWERACERAEVPKLSLYEGTKHSFATDAVRRGVPERVVQRMLGHRDVTSTRRYAKLAEEALVYALRDRDRGEDLSPACPSGESGEKNLSESNGLMVEAAGIEPGDDEPNSPEDKGSSS